MFVTWRWLRVLVTAGLVLCAVWVAMRTDLIGSLSAVRDLDPAMVVVASLAALAGVVNRGFLHRESRALHGVHHALGAEIRMSAAALALNKVVKSGGLAGLAFYVRCGRRDGASVAAVTRAFVTVGAAAQIALAGLAATALVLVPRDEVPVAGHLSDMVVGGVGVGALAVVVAVFIVGIGPSTSVHGIRRVSAAAARMILHAGVNKVLGICTLAAVLAATGTPVRLETVVLVYATALVGGALSIVPAGIGVVEASTVAVLTASGVDPGAALVAVLAFRFFDLWVPVGVGWVLARGVDVDLRPAGAVGSGQGVPAEPLHDEGRGVDVERGRADEVVEPSEGRRARPRVPTALHDIEVDLGALGALGELA